MGYILRQRSRSASASPSRSPGRRARSKSKSNSGSGSDSDSDSGRASSSSSRGQRIDEGCADFSQPVTAGWPLARFIPADGWERMKQGFRPRDMDDRWVVTHVVDGGGDEGIVFARSWTGYLVAKINVTAVEDGSADDQSENSRSITQIIWEGDRSRWAVRPEEKEAEAKRLVTTLCRLMFGVALVEE